MLFHGPPGVGKVMLAERVPGLLPDLDIRDSLEVSAVLSLAGFNLSLGCQHRRRGQRMATPGAISCAHKGVLFLDDSTEPQSTHPHLEISGGRVSVPGLATPPEGTSNRAPMIEAVWSKIHSLGVEVASCCWYAISESASEGTCDILTHAERFVPRKEV
jgi:hypothetical protein